MTTYFQLQIYACSNYNIIFFEQKKPTVKQKLFISLVSTFHLKMLCILFSYSYPVIRAVKGLKGKKILLQIKDIAEVILSLARLKLSLWYRIKNAIRIKNPYPWHLACVQTPHPPPPIPSVWIREEIFTERRGVCTQATDTSLPQPLMTRKRCWWTAGYIGVFMITHLACLDEKRQHKESVLSMETTQCRVHKHKCYWSKIVWRKE